MEHKFNYNWTLKDAKFTKDKGKVFSCFACGGGSTMGYKLAGFDVIGCNEIDPKMMEAYKTNHNPKFSFLEPIQTFKERKDLPKELYQLDILDGSPPCSSFSMAGNREKDWGKNKKFREGQAEQVLDDLFFHFIDLANELKPKIVIAENVKGLLLGNAKQYVRQIYREFDKAGYYCQHWLLNASKMGVPQRRERVFFIALRKDLAKPYLYQKNLFDILPKLELVFNEKEILFKDIMYPDDSREIKSKIKDIWHKCKKGYSMATVNNGKGFNNIKLNELEVMPTLTSAAPVYMPNKPNYIGNNHIKKATTFPLDYNTEMNIKYICGMSVPPVMVAQIATKIYEQWTDVFN